MTLIAVTTGGWILLGVLVVTTFAVAFSLFGRHSRRQIREHPRGDRRGETAPGAQGGGDPSGSVREDAPHRTRQGTR